ncbi:ROK family protein [Jeotgalibaca sp. MA1X17-3]|uniref:ROK family protein n=1 Tax=Jeotgalibaca sp. MA1X17-3 TaxID=2908211 RepID=UPI001F1F7670|nr:ROK family protein [Jeotgalibaca sp. MA1X17-3]UJF16611.1 ROK family protein [Jeotgalibaca sp. MA1X17-3]
MGNILAFDFGGTHVKSGLVNTQGHIFEKHLIKTPDSLENLLSYIKKRVMKYMDYDIIGIAISAPGAVSDKGYISGASAIPYIHGPNIKKAIEQATSIRTEIENDANSAALAEIWQGAAKGKRDVATVVIGTGIGGALIKEGTIHIGNTLHGGEFGYMILNPCNLGSHMNTFSELASTYSIIKRVATIKELEPSLLTGEMIFDSAEKGDEICKQAISEFFRMLAIGVYNIQYMYDPELILIGGGISQRDDLIPQLRKEINDILEIVEVATIVPKIERCTFQSDANLIGSVYHFLQKNN